MYEVSHDYTVHKSAERIYITRNKSSLYVTNVSIHPNITNSHTYTRNAERIYIAFQTYDTSGDGFLQVNELYKACVSVCIYINMYVCIYIYMDRKTYI